MCAGPQVLSLFTKMQVPNSLWSHRHAHTLVLLSRNRITSSMGCVFCLLTQWHHIPSRSYVCNTPMWGTVTFLALPSHTETKVRTKWSHGVQPTHRGHRDMPANKQKCVRSNPIAKAQHTGFCFAITNSAGTYENNASLLSLFFFYRPVEATLKPQAVCSATACFVLTTCKLLEKTTASTSARIICIYIYMYIYLWCYETVMPLNSFREQQAL